MRIVDALRGVIDPTKTTLHECRNCGETLAEAAETCPHCESDEVAHYEF